MNEIPSSQRSLTISNYAQCLSANDRPRFFHLFAVVSSQVLQHPILAKISKKKSVVVGAEICSGGHRNS